MLKLKLLIKTANMKNLDIKINIFLFFYYTDILIFFFHTKYYINNL